MYAQVNGLSPVPVIEQITQNQDIHSYQTRVTALSHVKSRRTRVVSKSFINIAPIYWTSLPRHMTSSKKLLSVNSRHKTYLFTQTLAD